MHSRKVRGPRAATAPLRSFETPSPTQRPWKCSGSKKGPLHLQLEMFRRLVFELQFHIDQGVPVSRREYNLRLSLFHAAIASLQKSLQGSVDNLYSSKYLRKFILP